jgi:hypothetical protein
MKLVRKKNGRIYPTKGSALFKHCSGGSVSITEREYPALEQVLLAHSVDYINVTDEEKDVEETIYVFEGDSG